MVDVDNLSTSQLSGTFTKKAHRENATAHAHTFEQICTCMHARMYTPPPHIRTSSILLRDYQRGGGMEDSVAICDNNAYQRQTAGCSYSTAC